MSTQILNNGTQVINNNNAAEGGTQIINGGTQVINNGTQILNNNTTNSGKYFTGGLLQIKDEISGWVVESKIPVQSGEADLYVANKDGKKGVIKYYRGNVHPKNGLLDNLVKLNHPDIINVYEYGNYKNHFYEIMEYAEGGSLDTRNEDGSYKFLPLSEDNVLQVCKEVINSFKTIHEKGIIHRDIKPANIYYRDAARTDVVIGDFGISSIMNEDEQLSHKTQTGSRTVGYAATEVLSGIISPKMDYYALGITLWELATGKNPFSYSDDNKKNRNEQCIIRDTIEGRIVDDLLSREPILSENLQHLIRGLLVIDDKKRWGYEEVTKHLNGEFVEVAKTEVKAWEFPIGDKVCTTLEDLGLAIVKNPDESMKLVYRGILSGFLEDKYPDVAKKIDEIIEDSSAKNENKLGLLRIIWVLKPDYPFVTKHNYKAETKEDVINLLINSPEEMLPLIKDYNSQFYAYIEHLGWGDKIDEIKETAKNIDNLSGWKLMQVVCWVAIILKDKKIRPFKQGKYKDFELSQVDQLDNVPSDLRNHVINLIKNKSFDGLLFPWLTFMSAKGIDWDHFSKWDDIKKIHSKENYLVVSQNNNGDYKTISEALDAAQSGWTIEVKKGTYRESLTIKKEITLTNASSESVIIGVDSGTVCTISADAKINNIEFTNFSPVDISEDDYGKNCMVEVLSNSTITNCVFSNSFDSNLRIKGNNINPIISNCKFNHSKRNGIYIDGENKPEINSCEIYHFGNHGLSIINNSKPYVKDCNIYNGKGSGVNIWGPSNPSIENSFIHNNENFGISIANLGVGTYKNCEIYSNGYSGFISSSSEKCVLENCKIYDNKQLGIYCVENSNISCLNCTINNNEQDGVCFINNSKIKIENSNIHGNADGGLWGYDKGHAEIANTKINNNHFVGVKLYGNSICTFVSSEISKSETIGIYTWENAECYCDNCLISENVMSNFEIKEKSKVHLKKCDVSNSSGSGIVINNKALLSIEDSFIQNNENYGINCYKKSKLRKRNCQIKNNRHGAVKKSGKIE